MLTELFEINCFYISLCVNKNLQLYKTELSEIKLFIGIKMDLALITYNGWSYLPIPPLGQDMTQGQFLSGV